MGNFHRLTAVFYGTLIAFSAIASSAMAQTTQPIVMRLSTATLNDAQHEWMKRFAVAIGKNTNGRIKAEVFPASQLGSIPRQIEGTQMGAIQGWFGPPEFLVGVDRRFEILSAPGLFKDEKQAFKVFDDAQFDKFFLSMAEKKGLTGIALFYVGPSSYDMRIPVRRIADLKNKKFGYWHRNSRRSRLLAWERAAFRCRSAMSCRPCSRARLMARRERFRYSPRSSTTTRPNTCSKRVMCTSTA